MLWMSSVFSYSPDRCRGFRAVCALLSLRVCVFVRRLWHAQTMLHMCPWTVLRVWDRCMARSSCWAVVGEDRRKWLIWLHSQWSDIFHWQLALLPPTVSFYVVFFELFPHSLTYKKRVILLFLIILKHFKICVSAQLPWYLYALSNPSAWRHFLDCISIQLINIVQLFLIHFLGIIVAGYAKWSLMLKCKLNAVYSDMSIVLYN